MTYFFSFGSALHCRSVRHSCLL